MTSTTSRWSTLAEAYRKWWSGTLGRALLGFSRPKPGARPHAYNWWTVQYPFDQPVARIVEDLGDMMEATEYLADAYPYLFPNFGPGALAVPLGSIPHVQPDTVWFEPIAGISIDRLALRMNDGHPWWKRIAQITQTACEQLPAQVPVTFTDLGGNLDILASLVGTEQLLTDVHDHPHHVRRAVDAITETWIREYGRLAAIIGRHRPGFACWAPTLWAPGKTYMLQCDFSYMISPAMFEAFVLPDLVRCCDFLEYPFYHLDGPGELPHLPLLLGIEKLRGIQWIPGAGNPQASDWPEVLKKIIDAGKLVQVFVDCKGALKILDTFPGEHFTMTIGGGNPDPKDLDRLLSKVT
jgi:hypothetical protein